MKIYGKKQGNIREENKSAVIDVLLKREATILSMSETLGLSHTSLAKIIKELAQKNVVQVVNYDTSFGRPSKIYGINGDCAISCAAIFSAEKVYFYYFDMRGFQINEYISDNDYSSAEDMVDDALIRISKLKKHPRLEGKVSKYFYIGLPSDGLFDKDFGELKSVVRSKFEDKFKNVQICIQRNCDYELVAETKYGLLKNGEKNAVLLSVEKGVTAALLLGGEIYNTDDCRHGRFCSLWSDMHDRNGVFSPENVEPVLKELYFALNFLNVDNVILGGKTKQFGNDFLNKAKSVLGDGVKVRFSVMGTEVPAPLSGAVWLAVYSTIQELMSR